MSIIQFQAGMNQDDLPLTDAFYENPLQFMQNHVRNLNNEIFLSDYHINNLYALLLIGRNSPWDLIKGDQDIIKSEIDAIVNIKVHEVKSILETLSNMYEDRTKKNTINHIEKLMGILRSRKKTIFIEKNQSSASLLRFQALAKLAKQVQQEKSQKQQRQLLSDKENQIQSPPQVLQEKQQKETKNTHHLKESEKQNVQELINQSQNKKNIQKNQEQSQIKQSVIESKQGSHENILPEHQIKKQQQPKQSEQNNLTVEQNKSKSTSEFGGRQVFSIFYGLSNLSNLTAMALTNVVEYNSGEKYLKFKMSQNYVMTIKSMDPFNFDKVSQLRRLPSQIFTSHIFPYLTASQLFTFRSVCKQWLQNVKQSWHATFKRQMFVQLLACEFCKDIQFHYKTIQLRNPFFQKLSLLIHALIEIINWDSVTQAITTNSLPLQLKRVLLLMLRLIGIEIQFTNLASLNEALFEQHKDKLTNIKQKVALFFSNLSGSNLSINDLRNIKTQFLDDHMMRVQQITNDDKTPLLLNLLLKQMTLQQILRSHIFLSQQYLLNTKKRLDNISKKMVYQKGYLQGVYKILLLRSVQPFSTSEKQTNELPNFSQMLQSIFTNQNSQKPDFVMKSKHSLTQIYLDNATKLDIILSTVHNLERGESGPEKQKEEQIQRPLICQQERLKKIDKCQIKNSVDIKIQCTQSMLQHHIQKDNIQEHKQNQQNAEK